MGTANEETIARVLYQIRADIVREGKEGLRHVEALLKARGLDPEAHRVPHKLPRVFEGRGARQRAVLAALQAGPATLGEVCERVARGNPGTDAGAIYHSVAVCLTSLKRQGIVKHEGRFWRLSSPQNLNRIWIHKFCELRYREV